MGKPTVVLIKSGPWKSESQFRNHPEFSAISKMILRCQSEFRFVLVGTSNEPTRYYLMRDNVIAWDIKAADTFSNITYNVDLMKILIKYRPKLVIVLGILNVIPVAICSLLSSRLRYVPIFIGEFGYYGRKRVGQILFKIGFKTLGVALRLSTGRASRMFTLSNSTKEQIEKLVPTLVDRIKLIYYPISPKFGSVPERSVLERNDELTVLTVAAIEPRKGLDVLLVAISLLPNKFKTVIKGSVRDSVYMEKLRVMLKMLKIEDRVNIVTEMVDYDALVSYYDSATLFVFPTREDCLGVVVLEALHSGLPVIATSVGGIPDMVEDGVNGLLVKANDPHELANAISLLLSDKILRRRLAENTRKVLHDRYYRGRVSLEDALINSIEEG